MSGSQINLLHLMGPADTSQAVYVVGSNPNSPQNPHSAPASGGNDIGNIDHSPPQEAHVIYGGVVGGPNKRDQFFDTRSDWIQNEVRANFQLSGLREK